MIAIKVILTRRMIRSTGPAQIACECEGAATFKLNVKEEETTLQSHERAAFHMMDKLGAKGDLMLGKWKDKLVWTPYNVTVTGGLF